MSVVRDYKLREVPSGCLMIEAARRGEYTSEWCNTLEIIEDYGHNGLFWSSWIFLVQSSLINLTTAAGKGT